MRARTRTKIVRVRLGRLCMLDAMFRYADSLTLATSWLSALSGALNGTLPGGKRL